MEKTTCNLHVHFKITLLLNIFLGGRNRQTRLKRYSNTLNVKIKSLAVIPRKLIHMISYLVIGERIQLPACSFANLSAVAMSSYLQV